MALGAPSALAHNPDTSYTRIHLEPGRIALRFTFDLEVLNRIAPLDADQDGRVTEVEYRARVPDFVRFLRRQVDFEINLAPADFGEAGPATWPADIPFVSAAEHGATLVHFPFEKLGFELPESITLNYRLFEVLGEGHTILAAIREEDRPDLEVIFTYFEPDYLYYTGEPEPAPESRLVPFFKYGLEHIFLGYDHILFLLALVVVSRFKEMLKVVTAFTVAHSMTLALAALKIVTLPSRFVETAIAGTIVYVAAENFWVEEAQHRWRLTFAFGLIHGFGFAGVLSDLGLPTAGFVQCLLSFNLGVEAGQIAIVVLLWPAAFWIDRLKHARRVKVALSAVIFLFGAAWLIDRAFALGWMP